MPKPIVWSENQPYFDGLLANHLVLQFCSRCERHCYYPRSRCPYCWSDELVWRDTTGDCTVESWTSIFRMEAEAFQNSVPIVLAFVRLKEGPEMFVRADYTLLDRLGVGQHGRVRSRLAESGLAVPWLVELDDSATPLLEEGNTSVQD